MCFGIGIKDRLNLINLLSRKKNSILSYIQIIDKDEEEEME